MADSKLNQFLARGTNAARIAFTPAPPTPASGPSSGYFWYATDTGNSYSWDGAAWQLVNNASGSVTTTGSPASGNLAKFSGTSSIVNGDLSGDVTTSGTLAATIANNAVTTAKINNSAVTLAKIANAAANSKLLGAGDAGSGSAYAELTLGTGLTMSGTTLNASAGGAWALAGTGQTATGVYDFAVDGGKANVDFIGLASFNELLVICRGLADGTTGARLIRVSVDNGATFFSAGTDYVIVDSVGVENASTAIASHSTNATAARSVIGHIVNTKGAVKYCQMHNGTGIMNLFVGSTSDINAIRVTNSGGGNFTAGTVRILAR